MTTQWNPTLLNRFLAPGISNFSKCDIPDLQGEHPEAPSWLANHFLNSVFRGQFSGKMRQYAVNLMFRAQAGFSFYHQARQLTQQFLAESTPHHPKSGLYFAAVAQWEACFLNHQVFIDVLIKMIGSRAFEQNDGSPEQRAYDIATAIKHWGGVISRDEHHEDDTVPMWLSNDGFQTRLLRLTYTELGQVIHEAAKVADDLQDPAARIGRNN